MPWEKNIWEKLLPITHERGYLIPAVGKEYVDCAKRLQASILQWHPTANITILTNEMLPAGDQGGQANDWQVFRASPYRQTIKLEADMLCAGPIDHWWTLFENRDVVISQGARTYYDQPAISRHYRKIFDQNNLPDVYNAITYWRLSTTAQEFFELVRAIFEQWSEFRKLLKFPDDRATTDVVYAMAAQILGVEKVTLPPGLGPQIVHMKRHIIQTQTDDWTQELVWEHTNPGLRIQTMAQHSLVHYYVKGWQ
jgi:hypothetical protein